MTAARRAALPRRALPRRSPSGPGLLLALLAAAAATVLMVTTGTGATWNGARAIAPGTLTSGGFSITVGGTTASAITLADMLPGDARAATLTVTNDAASAIGGRYTIQATGAGSLASQLRLTVTDGTPTQSGSASTGWLASCSGTALVSAVTPTSSIDVISASASNSQSPLAPGSSRSYCVLVSLDTGAATTFQGASGSVSFSVAARSVVRP